MGMCRYLFVVLVFSASLSAEVTRGESGTVSNYLTAEHAFATTSDTLSNNELQRVKDRSESWSDTTALTLAVVAQNLAPIAVVEGDITVEGKEGTFVFLHSFGSRDPDGDIIRYQWEQIAGQSTVVLNNADTASSNFNTPVVSDDTTLTFRLTVTDNDGATDSDTINVTVTPPNMPPTVMAGDDFSVEEGGTVLFSGSAADSDGSVSSYQWEQTAGDILVSMLNIDTSAASFVAPFVNESTTLTFRLTVTDNDGATATDSVDVVVVPVSENQPPVAGVENDIRITGKEVSIVTLSSSESNDPDGYIVSYQWAQIAGQPTVELDNANTSSSIFIVPDVNGETTLIFRLTVTDNDGATGSNTINVTLVPANENQAPRAEAGDNQTVDELAVVTLSAIDSSDDDTIVAYHWAQTAGPEVSLSNDASRDVTFTAPDVDTQTTLTFTLTVTDNDDATATDSVDIIVNSDDEGSESTQIDFETGDLSQSAFRVSGSGRWSVSANNPSGGSQYSAESPGELVDRQIASLVLSWSVSETGNIAFDRAVDSESTSDILSFYINDSLQGSWSGALDYETMSYEVPRGSHVFKWIYAKDTSGSAGRDKAWVDNIILPNGEVINRKSVAYDYDGDGKADIAVRRPGNFYQYIQQTGEYSIQRIQFGRDSSDIPVSGDFDGDGIADVGVRRASNQHWYIKNSSGVDLITGNSDGITRRVFGRQEEDIPVPADYDGDGITDIAVRRPSTQFWYIINSSGVDHISNYTDGITRFRFGREEEDVPVPADYDGDGKADLAVRRPSTQFWYIKNSSGVDSVSGYADGITRRRFGSQEADIPVPGDYDGDGKADIAVRRPSTFFWYILNSSGNNVGSEREDGIQRIQFGRNENDIPVPADYDGDGITDIGVRRPSSQYWYILNSSGSNIGSNRNDGIQRRQFGSQNTDIPLAAPISTRMNWSGGSGELFPIVEEEYPVTDLIYDDDF